MTFPKNKGDVRKHNLLGAGIIGNNNNNNYPYRQGNRGNGCNNFKRFLDHH